MMIKVCINKTVKVHKTMKQIWAIFVALVAANALAANLTDFEALSLSGDRTQIVLTFDAPVSEPEGYSIEDPARISLDFLDVSNALNEKYFQIGSGNTRSAVILDTGDRTRIVLSLSTLVSYATDVKGNVVSIYIGDGVESLVSNKGTSQTSSSSSVGASSQYNQALAISDEIKNVDFRRTTSGAGQVVVELANSTANASVFEESGDIVIKVEGYEVPTELRRRLDVIDFATAVHFISVYNEDNDALIRLEVDGAYDYLAYQTDKQMTLEVNQLTPAEADARIKEKFPFSGEKLSLNFQDIEVRDVLQIIANYVGFNLVASDSVQGTITLRLNNVPWDQALDLVLRTNGLDKRQSGNVIRVAPATELNEQDKLALEALDQAAKLAPLRTEYIQINYAKADDIAEIIKSAESVTSQTAGEVDEDGTQSDVTFETANGFLSARGTVAIDERTNTLIVTDTATHLEGIRRAVANFDVPVRQVLIEARIVTATTSINEGLGVRWGGDFYQTFGSDGSVYGSGSLEQNVETFNSAGTEIEYPDALAVNLPLSSNTGSFAVGIAAGIFDLDLELSALESIGQAEVISQPKVITSDGQNATIFSGQNVAILGELVEAGLKLDVTPQITPDDRVVLSLTVNQDSIASTSTTEGLTAIDTNSITTEVLVENGATLVLGGVYRVESTSSVSKTPILGDLPVLGTFFKRTVSSDSKSELLIFITPKLIKEGLVSN